MRRSEAKAVQREVIAVDDVFIDIPGEPVAQGRPRGFHNKVTGRTVFVDPSKSRSWKGAAQMHMRQQWGNRGLLDGPVFVEVLAIFTCPVSQHRKTHPREVEWKPGRPDAENVVKAVLDAATGIVWVDDSQVVRLTVTKIRGAQGEAPGVRMVVRSAGPIAEFYGRTA